MSTTIIINLPALAERFRHEHAACEAAGRQTIEHAIAAGNILIEAKSVVGHGNWLPWLRDNCHVSERTAQQYMRVARNQDQLQKRNGAADLSLRDAQALLTTPTDPLDEANELAAAVDELGAHARVALARIGQRLDDPNLSAADVAALVREAGDIQNRAAELCLRSERAAGKLLHSLKYNLVPPPGKVTVIYPVKGDTAQLALIVPSVHEGFYYVTQVITDDFGGASMEGTKKPVRADAIAAALDLRFQNIAPDYEDPDILSGEIPWDYNRMLFASRQEHVDHVILGKRPAGVSQ